MKQNKKKNIALHASVAIALPVAVATLAGVPHSAEALPLRSGLVAQTAMMPSAESLIVKNVAQINNHTIEVNYANGHRLTIDFYGDNILRLFRDDKGGIVRDPVATPPAKILVDSPRRTINALSPIDVDGTIQLTTAAVSLNINKQNGNITIVDLRTGKTVVDNLTPSVTENGATSVTLKSHEGEYFYGGGVQNGRFSHRGESIAIENTNNWVDGGVASPTPFYWSTAGYGMMWHTFRPGRYDFGSENPDLVRLQHSDDYLDLFVMVDQKPEQIGRASCRERV